MSLCGVLNVFLNPGVFYPSFLRPPKNMLAGGLHTLPFVNGEACGLGIYAKPLKVPKQGLTENILGMENNFKHAS